MALLTVAAALQPPAAPGQCYSAYQLKLLVPAPVAGLRGAQSQRRACKQGMGFWQHQVQYLQAKLGPPVRSNAPREVNRFGIKPC